MTGIWMRAESRASERRAPLVPADAARLVGQGVEVTVEESAHRVFQSADYAAAGCRIAPAGSWVDAPEDRYVLGLKELPAEPAALVHRHIFFGHAYKGQEGAGELLGRFAAGGGTLLDLEGLADDTGRRLAAFGYWAGYIGAALAVLHHRQASTVPLLPLTRAEWDDALRRSAPGAGGPQPTALVIGALGRCGRGACDALTVAGIAPTRWDLAETRTLDRAALLGHDLLVNTVLTNRPAPPFVAPADLDDAARRLSLICDVTCDVGNECHLLPVYGRTTDWSAPVLRVRSGDRPLEVIAIDNLPSLIPQEASAAFSADLAPHLPALGEPGSPWARCADEFRQARDRAGATRELSNADV